MLSPHRWSIPLQIIYPNQTTMSISGTSSTTKYSIPINKNNTQELNNSSFILKNYECSNIDITNLKENDSMLRLHYKRKYNKDNLKAYRGVSENTGSNGVKKLE